MDDLVSIVFDLLNETDEGVLVTQSVPDFAVWLPRSQINITPNYPVPGLVTIEMSEKLAIEKGLV